MNIQELSIDALMPNDWNPNRIPEDDMKRIVSRFIEKKAVDKPPTVRVLPDATYQILDGEQTWRAAKQAQFDKLPCIVIDADDTEAMATTFVKNLHGVMDPVVVGRNILRMKQLSDEGGKPLSNQQVAKLMNKTEGTVRNYLIYQEATAWCGKVESYPSEADIAGMQVKEVRALIDQMREGAGGTLAKQQPLPMEGRDGKTVAETMSDDEQMLKAFDKTLKAVKALDLEHLRKLKNEVNRMIRDVNKSASAEQRDADQAGEADAA